MRPPIQGLRLRGGVFENVCWQCTQRAVRQAEWSPRSAPSAKSAKSARLFSRSALPRAPASASGAAAALPRQPFRPGYFLSNALLARSNGTAVTPPVTDSPAPAQAADAQLAASGTDTSSDKTLLPHRRRQAARRNAATDAAQQSIPSSAAAPTNSMASSLPPDASSRLADTAAAAPADSLRRKLSALLSLSKPRLTVLVVLSAMVPYALYPVPAFLSSPALASAADIPSLSPLTLLFLTTGTTLCSAAANALNMLYEPDTDAKMTRTRTRPLVRRLLSTRAAVLFAVGCAAAGTAALYYGVNPTVAFLGATNIVLYAGAYTPLKRISAVNTWVGAIVGGIPPLMGWAAAAGESATGEGTWRELLFASDGSSLGGWLFAGLLFAWQFPHFMPLSWGIREEYKAAGLRMLCWVNPARNARVALRYSIVFVPLCLGLCAAGVTEWSFAVTSLPVNLWLIREAVKFWRFEGHKGSARGLFWASVWHLPVIMVLALAQKKGMWARVWRSVAGEPEEEEDEFDDDAEWIEEVAPASGAGIVGPAGNTRR
ncbi:Protoheme IX farnesyltransferase, mitochondrial [Staphylotrichum longicolle]|uniref:Protoheme IX farnesyltransferase, mitochondrial n=1 Tax=Staphylotrichum longicolle TaxID=669026 RepID=A0AAD4F5R1_9PEZI|nr:Protoheme IX farnesyltransferase, mitochondrial [Staphylotrichum longicolle]